LIKKLLIFLIITTVYASDDKTASSIFNMIVKNITKKPNANVYIHTKVDALQKYPRGLKIINTCCMADIVIISTIDNLPQQCQEKIIFGTRYSHLKNPSVVGAFFWQKGRPNILFYQERLEKKNIQLDSSFNKYIER